MAEFTTDGEMLHKIIATQADEYTRHPAHYSGLEHEGDFTAYIRAYPMERRLVAKESRWDELTELYVPVLEKVLMPRVPYDDHDAELARNRPDSELGIEVVGRYNDSTRAWGAFDIVTITAVQIDWLDTDNSYDVVDAKYMRVDPAGDELLLNANRLGISWGGHFHHEDHFTGPYVAHKLEEALNIAAAEELQTPLLLADTKGNIVRVNFSDDGGMTGMFYPPEDNPVLAYWNGGALSMTDREHGARQILPGERPFFNFTTGIIMKEENRGGYLTMANTGKEYREKQHVERYFTAIIDGLQPLE